MIKILTETQFFIESVMLDLNCSEFDLHLIEVPKILLFFNRKMLSIFWRSFVASIQRSSQRG